MSEIKMDIFGMVYDDKEPAFFVCENGMIYDRVARRWLGTESVLKLLEKMGCEATPEEFGVPSDDFLNANPELKGYKWIGVTPYILDNGVFEFNTSTREIRANGADEWMSEQEFAESAATDEEKIALNKMVVDAGFEPLLYMTKSGNLMKRYSDGGDQS